MAKSVHCPDPSYTDIARASRVQGIALLEVIISPAGQVQQVRSTKLLGYGLDNEAYNVVRTWKFEPATDGQGNPVTVLVPVEITFRLY